MTNTKPTFKNFVCSGDTSEWSAEGFEFKATIVECFDGAKEALEHRSEEDQQLFHDGRWFYCGVVVSVSRNGILLCDHAASLWGVDCNLSADNSYLAEVATELQGEATEAAHKEIRRIQLALAD